ncbi:MAG: flagellar motor protein MotB [Deltaproteobacteria bacterium]
MANMPQPEPEKENSERWLLTYSDLITLLLTFFIILYSISQQDAAKFQQVAESLNGALTGSKEIVGESPGISQIQGKSGFHLEVNNEEKEKAEQNKLKEIKKKVEALAKKEGLQSSISVTLEERGVAIRIVDRVLFNSGYADLTPQADNILRSIGKILYTSQGQYIRIEGHTDNVPISGKFASNWELSSSRATNVLRLFIDKAGINPRILSAVGYGEYRPLASNSNEEGRTKNRRVEIVILNTKFSQSESQSIESKKSPQTQTEKNGKSQIRSAQ